MGALRTPHCIGAHWRLMAPPTGICAFVVGNLAFYGDVHFDYRDGGLRLLWLEKCGTDANQQPSVGKGRMLESLESPTKPRGTVRSGTPQNEC